MSSLNDLLKVINESALKEDRLNNSESRSSELLIASIKETMQEIKEGADSSQFADLVILNFIMKADKENISSVEIQNFVEELLA